MCFKKNITVLLTIICISFVFSACSAKAVEPEIDNTKLSIVTTLFPQYDFTKQIVGDFADVTLLLPPGAESHSFEPSPSDVIRISNADIFIYTGDQMETWVPKLLAGIDSPNLKIIDVSKNIESTPSDPHIWTSPVNAKLIVQNINSALIEIDASHKDFYQNATDSYLEKLTALDTEFRQIVSSGKRKDFIFGSRFACYYFANEYGLLADSPYASCSAETEPGAQDMARVIDHIKNTKIPVIYYQELTDERIAQSVAEASGAKALLFHSCHNVSKSDFQNGATYISLMEQNAINLKEGLS